MYGRDHFDLIKIIIVKIGENLISKLWELFPFVLIYLNYD